MAKTTFTSVYEFLASQPAEGRRMLERVRKAIRDAVPGSQEVIAYNMPTYMLDGKRFLSFAVWRQHYAIYGATQDLLEAFREELAAYQVDKGTIRFPISKPVPVGLIGRIAKFRAHEVDGRTK